MGFPTRVGYRKYVIVFESEDGGTYSDIAEYEILSYSGSPYLLNLYPYRKYGTNEQGAKGDGTVVIPNLTFEIRGDGDPLTAGRGLYREMQFATFLRFDTYNLNGTLTLSYRIPLASAVGVTKMERLTTDSFRAEIEFISSTPYWTNLVSANEVIGVI